MLPPEANQPTFPFLKLPLELRHMIYCLHILDESPPMLVEYLTRRPRDIGWWPVLDLIMVNKKLHDEVLDFVCRMCRVSVGMNLSCLAYLRGIPCLRLEATSQDVGRCVRQIELEIHWLVPHQQLDFFAPRSVFRRQRLGENLEMVCKSLAACQRLESVTIVWKYPTYLHLWHRKGLCFRTEFEGKMVMAPAKHQILPLLRPLKMIRRRSPGIVIKMPAYGPMSSEELALEQRDYGDEMLNKAVERREDRANEWGDTEAFCEDF